MRYREGYPVDISASIELGEEIVAEKRERLLEACNIINIAERFIAPFLYCNTVIMKYTIPEQIVGDLGIIVHHVLTDYLLFMGKPSDDNLYNAVNENNRIVSWEWFNLAIETDLNLESYYFEQFEKTMRK